MAAGKFFKHMPKKGPKLSKGTKKAVDKRIDSRLENQVEMKSNVLNTTVAPGSAGNVKLITAITQGDTEASRDGNQVYGKLLKFRAIVTASTAATAGDIFRVLIVRDTHSDGVTPAVSDILNANGGSLVIADYNQVTVSVGNKRNRFQILYDRTNSQDLRSAGAGAQDLFNLKRDIKRNMKIVYNATGSTVTSIQQGAVYCVTVALNNTNASSIAYQTVFYYTDM